MKNSKRMLCMLLCSLVIIGAVFCAVPALAKVASTESAPSLAWLSDCYIRESSTDFVKNKPIPDINDYKKSPDAFRKEIDGIKTLINTDIAALSSIYIEIVEKAFELINGAGLDTDYSTAKEYLETEHGIVYPENESSTDAMYTTIAYMCLKYDLLYPIAGIHFTVEPGTTLDRTVVLIAAAILGDNEVGPDINSLDEYAILKIKRSLVENGYLPSEDTELTNDELLRLYKIMISERQGYMIENKDVYNYTEADDAALNNSYAAAIVKLRYGVEMTPEAASAAYSEDPDALAKAILITMIEQAGAKAPEGATLEQLLDTACRIGCFKLDDGFYSDIYNYDVYLTYKCSEIWVTPFAYIAQLKDKDISNVKISINGVLSDNGKSARVAVAGATSKVKIEVIYNDGVDTARAEYAFRIHNGEQQLPSVETLTPSSPSFSQTYNPTDIFSQDMPSYFYGYSFKNPLINITPFDIPSSSTETTTDRETIHTLPSQSTSGVQNEENSEAQSVAARARTFTVRNWKNILSIAVVLMLLAVLIILKLIKKSQNNV